MTPDDVVRFMSMVQKLPCGCWFWTGARSRGTGSKQWYGSFSYGGKIVRAHRFAHDHLAGRVLPAGWHRDHVCRFTLCVNPEHLVAVPNKKNRERVGEHSLLTLARMVAL